MAEPLKINSAEVKECVRSRLRDEIFCTDEKITEIIEEEVFKIAKRVYMPYSQTSALIRSVSDSIRGFDVLQPLLDDKSIDEIMVIGKDKIYTESCGVMQREPVYFESEERLMEVISRMAAQANRTVNEARPIVDSRLKNGSRINVVLPPVALDGPTLTVRKFPEKPFDLERLTAVGTLTEEAAAFLKEAVQRRYNIFICGGTGTGKTTFLNALSNEIPQNERIITIEDSAELALAEADNLVRLESRNANVEGKGAIGIRELIRTALRMRPDRIIVGEVRGKEALDMLQAMNTGHEGSMSTGHANSPRDMLYRLETMVLFGVELPLAAIRQQICSSIDIIIHLERGDDFKRRVTSICELTELRAGEIELNELFALENTDLHRLMLARKGRQLRTGRRRYEKKDNK